MSKEKRGNGEGRYFPCPLVSPPSSLTKGQPIRREYWESLYQVQWCHQEAVPVPWSQGGVCHQDSLSVSDGPLGGGRTSRRLLLICGPRVASGAVAPGSVVPGVVVPSESSPGPWSQVVPSVIVPGPVVPGGTIRSHCAWFRGPVVQYHQSCRFRGPRGGGIRRSSCLSLCPVEKSSGAVSWCIRSRHAWFQCPSDHQTSCSLRATRAAGIERERHIKFLDLPLKARFLVLLVVVSRVFSLPQQEFLACRSAGFCVSRVSAPVRPLRAVSRVSRAVRRGGACRRQWLFSPSAVEFLACTVSRALRPPAGRCIRAAARDSCALGSLHQTLRR